MKYLATIFLSVICFGAPLTAHPFEEDLEFVIKKMYFPDEDAQKQFVSALATSVVAMGDKTMDVDTLTAKVIEKLNSSYELKRFYPIFLQFFDRSEIQELRSLIESDVYQKYQKNSVVIVQQYMGLINQMIGEVVDEYGEEKETVTLGESRVLDVTVETFEKEVLQADTGVIVDFYADWCGPCKMMKPIFDELSIEYPDVKFVKVNSDHAQALLKEYKVAGLPTFLLFKNGQVIDKCVGMTQKEDFSKKIKGAFSL